MVNRILKLLTIQSDALPFPAGVQRFERHRIEQLQENQPLSNTIYVCPITITNNNDNDNDSDSDSDNGNGNGNDNDNDSDSDNGNDTDTNNDNDNGHGHECFFNFIETQRTCFLLLKKLQLRKKVNNWFTLIIKMQIPFVLRNITLTARDSSVFHLVLV